jgi:hypothetical protein
MAREFRKVASELKRGTSTPQLSVNDVVPWKQPSRATLATLHLDVCQLNSLMRIIFSAPTPEMLDLTT